MPATVGLACASVAILASAPLDPVHAGRLELLRASEAEQLRELAVATLGEEPAAEPRATSAVEPLAYAPERPRALVKARIEAALPDAAPVRLRGRIGDGLYQSLLANGLSAATAADYLSVLRGQPGISGDIAADDHFDLVLSGHRTEAGLRGALLYAAIDRVGASDIRVMKWPVGGRPQWLDAGATERSAALGWPVAGRVTSGFGIRRHPILHFARSHRGIDIAARWGQPITAVADGQVARSGWAGGYGRQVRIAHAGGIATSYSHMSRTAVAPGSYVRAGQVIGYVGSSGLSTGPHLHYEVHRGGVAVNPLGVRFAGRARIEGAHADRFRAQLGRYLAMAVHRPG